MYGGPLMAARAAVLFDERDNKIGKVMVRETTFIIKHNGAFFVRTSDGIRLTRDGVGMGAVFRQTEVFVRERLEPA